MFKDKLFKGRTLWLECGGLVGIGDDIIGVDEDVPVATNGEYFPWDDIR